MTNIYNVTVNPNKSKVVDTGYTFSQGDFGFQLAITVEELDTTGTTCKIAFRKPSGSVEATGLTASGNTYTYTIRGTELDTPGPVVADLKFINSTTQRISTASFIFHVTADTLNGAADTAHSYSDTIQQLVDDLDGSVVKYSDAQTLTDAEKEQARTNIGAESIADANQIKQDLTELDSRLSESINDISDAFSDKVGQYSYSDNRLDRTKFVLGSINSAGAIIPSTDTIISDFLPVSDLQSVKFGYWDDRNITYVNTYYCIYDDKKELIGTRKVGKQGIDVSTADYIRVVFSDVDYIRNGAFVVSNDFDVPMTTPMPNRYTIFTYVRELTPNDAIIVSKNGDGDYTSLTEAVFENASKKKQIFQIKEGVYDLYDEFIDYFGASYFETFTRNSYLGLIFDNGNQFIFDSLAKVVFNYDGNNTVVQQEFSPFYIGYNGAKIVNATVECSNCRYAIHDDAGSYDGNHTFELIGGSYSIDNRANGSWGAPQVLGGGLGANANVTIKDAYFKGWRIGNDNYIVSYHNSGNAKAKSKVVINGCYLDDDGTIKCTYFGTSTEKSLYLVSNNSLGSNIFIGAENSSATVNNIDVRYWNNEVRV